VDLLADRECPLELGPCLLEAALGLAERTRGVVVVGRQVILERSAPDPCSCLVGQAITVALPRQGHANRGDQLDVGSGCDVVLSALLGGCDAGVQHLLRGRLVPFEGQDPPDLEARARLWAAHRKRLCHGERLLRVCAGLRVAPGCARGRGSREVPIDLHDLGPRRLVRQQLCCRGSPNATDVEVRQCSHRLGCALDDVCARVPKLARELHDATETTIETLVAPGHDLRGLGALDQGGVAGVLTQIDPARRIPVERRLHGLPCCLCERLLRAEKPLAHARPNLVVPDPPQVGFLSLASSVRAAGPAKHAHGNAAEESHRRHPTEDLQSAAPRLALELI
jgi:hypothetical protein